MASAALVPGPCAVFISCSSYKPEHLIREVIGDDVLPEPEMWADTIQAYPWHINTKYYSADVHLCTLPTQTLGCREFTDAVQAVVIHFDSKSEESLSAVRCWLTFVAHWQPDVRLLVCETLAENSGAVISREKLRSYCLKVAFELVERYGEPSSGDEADDSDEGFEEVELGGMRRVVQALHAHLWPNLELKDASTQNSLGVLASQLQDHAAGRVSDAGAATGRFARADVASHIEGACEHTEGACGSVEGDKDKKDTENMKKQTTGKVTATGDGVMDRELLTALGNEDPGGESFEQLFERMRIMKEHAATLPHDQRKVFAEQVAIQFWRAIGGAEDEIDQLDIEDE
ncbi:PREDICTED: alpha- and gamma-adaptin-binding protein p34-like [Priapulus caudatus]|uniref:Alpha- and gamma-adaptin-binding protein p34-like n=1 Tax=Priapulus caudatus TaxID=37621 RepID=A0ABM1EYJ7_PRICU|nr:PREDICTED: alpha- and gamma-adaptin-binding protein p34-like [Priapulus caudatus]